MVKRYLNLSIFTVFLKDRNIISKIRRSKVTDYAALTTYLLIFYANFQRFISNRWYSKSK